MPETREAWLAETLAVMALPDAVALFGPGSRAEVALSGQVGQLLVAGQVDRLAVTPTPCWWWTTRPTGRRR